MFKKSEFLVRSPFKAAFFVEKILTKVISQLVANCKY